jgi:geranylgeranyl reductase family protein
MYDVIVIGGGPAGSSCTAYLAKSGKKVLLLDRAKFPRDKTCGDGISGRSVSILKEVGVLDDLKKEEHHDMYGVTFSSPNGTVVPVSAKKDGVKEAPGFVCRRMVFDNVLFQNAKKLAEKTIEEFMVTELIMDGERPVGVKGTHGGQEMEFRAKMIVGADGAAGMSARKLGGLNDKENHQLAGVRAYYEGVKGNGDKIELHFVKESLPGYFWVFPLPDGNANVGVCILVNEMKKRKLNLSKIMEEIITENPVFKPRFSKAKRTSQIRSWLLPLATNRVKSYGNGYVLIGDASSLIDPFTGEGIGNSLTSAKTAAKVIDEAFAEDDFSEKKFSEYKKRLFDIIGEEIDTDSRMLRMANHEFLLNLVIGKAKRSKEVQSVIADAIIDPDNHKSLTDPFFFIRALFA